MSQGSDERSWTSEEVVETFLDFFRSRGHREVLSSSLVPDNDPTVLLTTAGVQQFIPYMLGRQEPPGRRLCSIQKCFRSTDIDQVGDRLHDTFFEMLGNFSIGDYFKERMIPWAWELVTTGFRIPPERVWVTVYPSDEDAERLWRTVGVPGDRVIPDEENFWGPPGRSGPCGPDTELYFDRGVAFGCGTPSCRPGCDCDRFLEFWNLVFMQDVQDTDGTRTPLEKPNIDTGLGLERITSVLQATPSIYETDLFLPILRRAEQLSGARYGADEHTDYALRVLADHGRAMTFLVADGVLPSNEGRGYVLRRVIRRAVRHGHRLGLEQPFVVDLAEAVIERMGHRHSTLRAVGAHIQEIVAVEERRFRSTLQTGLTMLDRWIEEARAAGATELPGEHVFRLYDTYGFPRELSEEIIAEEGLTVPAEEFERAMAAQRERSRAGARFGVKREERAAMDIGNCPPTTFIGYARLDTRTPILAANHEKSDVVSLHEGQSGTIVLAETPFYGESGGQVGDTGEIITPHGRFRVEDTQHDESGHILHLGRLIEGELAVGDTVEAIVDAARRHDIMRHHSVTHLLHRSLREILGPGAVQAGSLVAPQVARFDFPHGGPVPSDRLEEVEDVMNRQILADLPVLVEELPYDEATTQGAVAFFGEKYGSRVRVVTMGTFSKELCGGTHVSRTGELGAAYVISEAGIGSGMRRVEIVAGGTAHELTRARGRQLRSIAERLAAPVDHLDERVVGLLNELRDARRENARLQAALAEVGAETALQHLRVVNGVKLVTARGDVQSTDALLRLKDAVQRQTGSGTIIVLGAIVDGRVHFVASVTDDLIRPGLDAVVLVRQVAAVAGGSGGGNPQLARAGGGDPQKLDAAIAHAESMVRDALGAKG
ncbi:MAG: alanine--tRNA ligase [Chloroflexi bacterium]|nr:alanine--tRNA ligase [Chloroflexota bacterium]